MYGGRGWPLSGRLADKLGVVTLFYDTMQCFFVVSVIVKSTRAHFHVVGKLQIMSDINQPSLQTLFYSVFFCVRF